MAYKAKTYKKLVGMAGFSEVLLNKHFTVYYGYVANCNKLLDILGRMRKKGKAANPEFLELKRKLDWEFNGMRLHEYYFENLGGTTPHDVNGTLAKRLVESFGSIEEWKVDFLSTGSMRDIGWTVLYQDSTDDRLVNFWINEHDEGHPTGYIPILVMDVFEHAFTHHFDLKRSEYIEVFFKNIDWKSVESRLI